MRCCRNTIILFSIKKAMNNKRRIATPWIGCAVRFCVVLLFRAIPHNSKCRYDERGAADAKPKAQIILDAAKVSAASGGNSEPKQGQRSQSARGFCLRSTMRVPQPDIIEHFGNADAVPQPPERCLSRQAGIVRCCLKYDNAIKQQHTVSRKIGKPVCCCFYLERGNGEIGTKRV